MSLKFNKNDKFKIMQIADIQECATISPDTIKLITLAILKEKPDLIVLTGDQIYGIHPSFYSKDRKIKAEKTIKTIAELINSFNIPFAVTFGNHDNQAGLSNSEQAQIYNSFSNCIHGEYRSKDDMGTFRLPIYDNNNHIFDVYLFDTNGQSLNGEYLGLSKKQIDWFKNEREKAKENNAYTKSIVFQHIPVPEFYDILEKSHFFKLDSVEAFRTYKRNFFTLPKKIKEEGGFMLESPAVPDYNIGEFDTLLEKGNVIALAVGHDHNNSFVGEKSGIKLIYTQCAGFNVYGPKKLRGVRIFNLDKNNLNTFETYTVTYNQLTNDKLSSPIKEFILTHIPTSMEQVKRLVALCSISFSLSAIIAYKITK